MYTDPWVYFRALQEMHIYYKPESSVPNSNTTLPSIASVSQDEAGELSPKFQSFVFQKYILVHVQVDNNPFLCLPVLQVYVISCQI